MVFVAFNQAKYFCKYQAHTSNSPDVVAELVEAQSSRVEGGDLNPTQVKVMTYKMLMLCFSLPSLVLGVIRLWQWLVSSVSR